MLFDKITSVGKNALRLRVVRTLSDTVGYSLKPLENPWIENELTNNVKNSLDKWSNIAYQLHKYWQFFFLVSNRNVLHIDLVRHPENRPENERCPDYLGIAVQWRTGDLLLFLIYFLNFEIYV